LRQQIVVFARPAPSLGDDPVDDAVEGCAGCQETAIPRCRHLERWVGRERETERLFIQYWGYGVPMAVGTLIGGHLGGALTGSVNRTVLRVLVMTIGFGLAGTTS
jgi:hypothetical protein